MKKEEMRIDEATKGINTSTREALLDLVDKATPEQLKCIYLFARGFVE